MAALTESEKRRARVVKDASGKETVTVCRDANFHKEMVYLDRPSLINCLRALWVGWPRLVRRTR